VKIVALDIGSFLYGLQWLSSG